MPSRRLPALGAALALLLTACGAPVATEVATQSPAAIHPTASPPPSHAPSSPACADEAPTTSGPAAWWRDAVFYEVFVRSFADSDGDGIGDLQGLIGRLDELNDGDPATTDDLGVTALWLMPVASSPSYHGYDVVDYTTVDIEYGTNDDFKALVAAAGERGMRVIVDLVMNHTSVQHPWFQDARAPGATHEPWYVWADQRSAVAGPGGRTVWHPDGDRWYYGYFSESMPDLDVTNPEVTGALDDAAAHWLTEMGAAGFRLDAARHLIEEGDALENTPATFEWLARFRDQAHATDPDALVLGEVWDATSMTSRYVRDGALDLVFEFDLAAQMLLAVRSGDAGSLELTEEAIAAAYPDGGYARFLTNHDQDRTFDVLGQDMASARQAATLLLTGPGVPFVYYGEEIGLRGRKPDERIRTPMPWTGEPPGHGFTTGAPWEPFAEGVASANVAAQTVDTRSLLEHYRDLIRLRAAEPALGGDATTLAVEASSAAVHAVLRHAAGGRAVVVVSNLADEPVADVLLTLESGPLCGSPRASIMFATASDDGPTRSSVDPPDIDAAGGFADWAIGAMAAHEDLVIALDR
jgi:glycosidase